MGLRELLRPMLSLAETIVRENLFTFPYFNDYKAGYWSYQAAAKRKINAISLS